MSKPPKMPTQLTPALRKRKSLSVQVNRGCKGVIFVNVERVTLRFEELELVVSEDEEGRLKIHDVGGSRRLALLPCAANAFVVSHAR